MKRRTNLFYNSGEDSKFLTFSNYTECLTGAFLSTNTKSEKNKNSPSAPTLRGNGCKIPEGIIRPTR